MRCRFVGTIRELNYPAGAKPPKRLKKMAQFKAS